MQHGGSDTKGFRMRPQTGNPNNVGVEYTRDIIEYKDPGRYIPIVFLLHSWGSLVGVPTKVPLDTSSFMGQIMMVSKSAILPCWYGFQPQILNTEP